MTSKENKGTGQSLTGTYLRSKEAILAPAPCPENTMPAATYAIDDFGYECAWPEGMSFSEDMNAPAP